MKIKIFSVAICLICGLFFFGNGAAKIKYPAPKPTTEFEKMSYAPVYPTYSWEALPNTEFYQVQLLKDGKVLRELKNTESVTRVTDNQPLTEVGDYYWRVRVIDKKNNALSDWSEVKYLHVTAPVEFAVLGDSISHGGADFIPAGQLACQWQTFCSVPIKNIAHSGDTTQQMLERFERDVLPFKPKNLIIFGGINDIRSGITANSVIKNLETLKQKCAKNNITPIFVTLTPMNARIMQSRGIFLAKNNWRGEREKVNAWILNQKYAVDISQNLYDNQGELRADFTPDGLHPDLRGKKFIGEEIEKFLVKNFSLIGGI